MSSSTRRGFLALSATAVATGVVSGAAAPSALAAEHHGAATDATSAGSGSGPLLAYVHDASRGEVTVMRGEHEVVVHDPQLVRALTKHAGR